MRRVLLLTLPVFTIVACADGEVLVPADEGVCVRGQDAPLTCEPTTVP